MTKDKESSDWITKKVKKKLIQKLKEDERMKVRAEKRAQKEMINSMAERMKESLTEEQKADLLGKLKSPPLTTDDLEYCGLLTGIIATSFFDLLGRFQCFRGEPEYYKKKYEELTIGQQRSSSIAAKSALSSVIERRKQLW